ncbi:ABC transporter-like protein [Tricladium varicosporioides]|nr:ABC transporter-like protein [Hymenoscyphus varicosporioides]
MVSIRISAAMRLAYLRALFRQPISVLDTLPPGQTAAILTITANVLQIGISEKISMLIQSISLVITALVVSFHYSWLLTLVTSSGLLFIVVFYSVTIPFLVRGLKEVEHADRMSSSIASEVFGAIKMIAACGAETKMMQRYAGWVKESRRRGLKLSPLVAIQQAPAFFAIHATFALSFWYAIKLYLDFRIASVSTMIIVLMSIMTIVISIGSITNPITTAAQAAGAASILFTIIDAPQPHTDGIKTPKVSAHNDIVFESVNFTYPLRPDVKVLDNLSIRFPAGKRTAIVGATGSGKSTIVGLIERWYELDGNMTDNMLTLYFRNGSITIGGQKLHDIDIKWWRSQIGLVQQEPFLFNTTIFKNVEFGLIGTKWEHASKRKKRALVKRACEEAFADEFISRLPEGYKTQVGDSGLKLSGGQRQRLAIARSIVKQPKILILDEATSAIDVRGERMVQAALDKVSKNRTTITVAHRLSTIMSADNIVVLRKGQVVQQGTHEKLLLDTEGVYHGLANAQQLLMEEYVEKEVKDLDKASVDSDLTIFERVSLEVERPSQQKIKLPASKISAGSFRLFLWEQKPQWRWYSLMGLGALGAGVSFPMHAFLFAKLISLFNFWGEYLQSETNWWCLMFAFLALGVGISYFVLGWSSNTVSFNITANYRQEYFQNVLSKPVSYYDEVDNSIGSLTSRMASDPTQLQQLLGINMAIVFISIFNVLGSIMMSFYFGWKLTLLTVISVMPIILAAGFFRIRYETQFEKMNYEVFAESSKFATECIGAFRTVSSLTLEEEICYRFEILLKNHTSKAFQKAKFATFVFAMSDSVALLCMAFVLWYGGRLLASHEYSPFSYLVVYLAVVQGSTSAGQSLSFGPNVAQAFAAANRIRTMRSKNNEHFGDKSLNFDDTQGCEKNSKGIKIELRNVWFTYPTRDIPVLKGLNITIDKGQFAAIVGPSGCGKTSIISLLERFYTAQSGQILYHDTDINDINLTEYRNTISLVAQEPSLIEGSIRQNILLGVDEDTISDETLQQICRDAEIHDFISSLPEGYDTEVGAKGVALSGGQKQRIAIARALIRNPRVLLLDEATSNLDSETERSVQAVFERTSKGRTMVVVAHRLATVQNADVIFVMGDGCVMETGNHAELLRKRGLYYQMCQSQALDR